LPRHGFTLLEILVAVSIFAVALVAIVQAVNSVQKVWQDTHAKTREFREARAAMEALNSRLSQATLNNYWDYPPSPTGANTPEVPPIPVPNSDLHFVSGSAAVLLEKPDNATGHAVFFQAPIGYAGPASSRSESLEYGLLPDALCAWGFYVEFGDDHATLPSFLRSPPTKAKAPPRKRHRFRLMEFRQPAHELTIFKSSETSGLPDIALPGTTIDKKSYKWFNEPLSASTSDPSKRRSTVVAENILAMILSPRDPRKRGREATSGNRADEDIAPKYLYDTRAGISAAATEDERRTLHRLPAAMQITIIALDEADFANLTESESIQLGGELKSAINGRFRRARDFENDMGSVQGDLNRRKLRYRILTSTVPIPGGRWSLMPTDSGVAGL
jgi:uncharacterized protein (TIGR02599 family)